MLGIHVNNLCNFLLGFWIEIKKMWPNIQDNKRQYVSGYKQQKMHLSVFPFWLLIKALILWLDLQGQNTHAEQLSLS